MKWTATLEFWFQCPDCGLTVLEGNPRKCPHQNGPKALYNPVVDGRVANWILSKNELKMEPVMQLKLVSTIKVRRAQRKRILRPCGR